MNTQLVWYHKLMSELDQFGAEHRQILDKLADLKPRLHAAMRKERQAGATQNSIRERSGYKTIQRVRAILAEPGGK